MRRSAAPLVRALALGVLVALPFALVGACSTESGVTPSCTPNIDANGIQTNVDDGCTGFAVCALDPKNPKKCCTGDDGKTLEGNDLDLCLFFYGAHAAPTTATSTGTGTSSSSSSSSTSSSSSSTGGGK